MSSTRKLTEIPSCMVMSFRFPWESSPEKLIPDPLTYDLPDFTSDFATIYGERAAIDFSHTPSTHVLQEDSSNFLELFGPEETPESPPKTNGSFTSSSGCVNDPSSLSCRLPSSSPERGVSGRKRGGQAPPKRNFPYEPRPLEFPPPAGPLAPSDLDNVFASELMRSMPRNRPAQNDDAPRGQGVWKHRYCRYSDCPKRFQDRRTTERHRLTHLEFGTFACPNLECPTRTRARPNFSREFSLSRHIKAVGPGSPCAKYRGAKISPMRVDVDEAEALLQQAMVPFDPAIHVPFSKLGRRP